LSRLGTKVVVSPTKVTPRQTVTAVVATDEPIDSVNSARLDWGYTNFYRCHSATRADSVADDVGTDHGDYGDTDDCENLPIATGGFTGGSSTFRIPSWAPASSAQIARWSCRLVIERDGRDVDARGDFTVAIGTDDVDAVMEPMEVVAGAAETVIDLALSSAVYRAGEAIRGEVTLTPTVELPDGDLAVSWQRERESHPLTRTPGPSDQLQGRIISLGKRITLRADVPVIVPFEIPLPPDAPPTAAAVHSSLDWFVQAQMTYAGFSEHMPERVRRPIVVVNAP
jgi:hypothetical protein